MNILNHSQELDFILFCDTGQILFVNKNEKLMAYIKQNEKEVINFNRPLKFWMKQWKKNKLTKVYFYGNRDYIKRIKSKQKILLKRFFEEYEISLNTDERIMQFNQFDLEDFSYLKNMDYLIPEQPEEDISHK